MFIKHLVCTSNYDTKNDGLKYRYTRYDLASIFFLFKKERMNKEYEIRKREKWNSETNAL